MAKIQKTSPLLGLKNFQVFLNDTVASSNYFRVSELSDTFTAGKNGFLIEGSPFLRGDTEIKIEVLDTNGDPLFTQAGEGIPEYYEGLSKLVTAHVYQTTPIGIGKITILGELKSYIDENGFEQPIPNEWDGVYNVKWEKDIKINKNIPNETRVRFIKRPIVEIEELDESFYAKNLISTAQSSSTVRGYALTPSEGTDIRGYRGAIRYYLEVQSGSFKDGATTISVAGTGIQDADVLEYLNQSTVIVRVPYTGSDNTIQRFESGSYALNYQFFTNPTESPILGSFGRFSVSNLATFVGDVERLKVFRKSRASNLDYSVIQDIRVDSSEILTNVISGSIERVGYFTGSYLDGTNWNTYWNTASSANTSLDSSKIYKAVKFKNNTISSNLGNDLRLYSGSEYTLEYYTLYDSSSNNTDDSLSTYLTSTLRSGSGIVNYYLTQSLEYLTGSNQFRNSVKRSVNFIPSITDDWTLNFKSTTSTANAYWQVGSVSLKTSNELGYSPDSFNFIIPIDRQLEQETFDFKFEYFDINNNYVPIDVFAQQQFVSGNIKLIDKEIIVDADKNYFSFDSDLIAIPDTQQVNISISKNRVLGNLLITSQAFDTGGVPIPPASYSALPSPFNKYPGSFGTYSENLYSGSAVLTLNSFTGSRHSNPAINNVTLGGTPYGSVIVDRIVYTLTETSSSLPATKNFTIFRQSDGEKDKQVLARANKNQFTYKRTTLAPDPSSQRIVLSVDRLNLPSSSVYPIQHVKSGGNLLATLSGSANTSPLTFTLDAGTNSGTTFVTGSGFGSTTYIFQQLDRRGVAYTGSVTIDPVILQTPLLTKFSKESHTFTAKSTGEFDDTYTNGDSVITAFIGDEQINYDASATNSTNLVNNRWYVSSYTIAGNTGTPVIKTLGTSATSATVGISSFPTATDTATVSVTITYKDGSGAVETYSKTIVYSKAKRAAPVLDFIINNSSQTTDAKSTGEQITAFGNITLSVKDTYQGTTTNRNLNAAATVTATNSYTGFSATNATTITLANLANATDTSVLTITGLVTDSEGVVRTVVGTATISKSRKAAPVLKIEITNKSQSVTAKSTGVQIGAFSNPIVTVSETYNGSTTTKTITALSATSADIASISTTPSTGTITLNGKTLANGTDSAVVAVSATITDSEATSRSVTDTVSVSKIKNAAPTTLVTITPEGQNVASASSGYGTPASVQVVAKESSNYTEDKVSPFADSTFYISSITNGVTGSSGTFTPSTPTSDAGVTTTIVVSYVNSEGVAGSETRTHKVTPAKEGRQGPGLLFIGDYATKKAAEPTFVLNNNATKKDAVKHSGKFYAFRGADLTTIGATSTPTNGGDASWEEFTSFSAISTGLLITENSFVQQTLNVGTNAAGDGANITIWGGDTRPYISIGQGTKGYDNYGIFMGYVGTPPTDGFKMSILNNASGKYFKWNGTDLLINAGNFSLDSSGNISATNATLSGNVTCTTLTANQAGTIGGWSISPTTLNANSNRTILGNDGTIRLKDTDGAIKVLLDYGLTSTADPANSSTGQFLINSLPQGTATFLNGVLSGQGIYGYLQVPYGTATGDPTSGTTYVAGDWPFAPTWNRETQIFPTITAAYEFRFTVPTSSLRKTRWNGGTYQNGYVEMRLYIKDQYGVSMYQGTNGLDYVAAPTETVQATWNYGNQYNPTVTTTSFYMSGVNLVAGDPYTVTVQYIVFNLQYDNDVTIDYYYPSVNIDYGASVASTVINQAGFNVGQDTDRYMFLKPGLLSSMDLVNFPNPNVHVGVPANGTNSNLSFQDRRTIGEIGGTFLLLNSSHIEWHSGQQQIYINSAQFSRSNRAAGGNIMTSYFFGGYNRAFQLIRAYAFFEPDSSTNNSGLYSDYAWPYNYNIEKITYVTTNTFQVYFVEAVMDTTAYDYPSAPRYSVDIMGINGKCQLNLQEIFDVTPTSFKMKLSGEISDGSIMTVIVYK
jgi:hypothetical protein